MNTPPAPALPPDAPTVTCPTVIEGSLDSTDATQTGRHSRVVPVSACGATKTFPGNAADPTNPHLFDVYRFANPSSAAVCFSLTLTDGASGLADGGVADAGADGGADESPDASVPEGPGDDRLDAGLDAAAVGTGTDSPIGAAAPAKYMTAYAPFYPTDLTREYRGDVGDVLVAPQTMAITVPAGGTIDVVVYAVDVAPGGVGAYTLTCSTQ